MSAQALEVVALPGDGIGVEVTEAAITVLQAAARRHGLGLRFETLPAGATHYRQTGDALPDATYRAAEAADAILFGAMGLPDVRTDRGTEIAPQVDLRMRMRLSVGLRPARLVPGVPSPLRSERAREIDFLIVRELTEGLFACIADAVVTQEEARDTLLVTRATTTQLTLAAIAQARKRAAASGQRPRVTIVDKSNALPSFAYMRKVFLETCATQPDVEARTHYVDAMALDLVRRPWDFGVLVVENLCGDILSDLAAALVGGLGFAPSGEIGPRNALFQPCHGSAPDIAGQGIANPAAAILSGALMLEYLADRHALPAAAETASTVRAAVDQAFGEGLVRTLDIGGADRTARVTEVISGLCAGRQPA